MTISKVKQLSNKYGGNWKYDGRASWWCDDGTRHVSRTSRCTCDDYCNCPYTYWLYSKENRPEQVVWDGTVSTIFA